MSAAAKAASPQPPRAGWRDRRTVVDLALDVSKEREASERLKLQDRMAAITLERERRDAEIRIAAAMESERHETELVRALRTAIDPILFAFCEEPSRSLTRKFIAAWRAIASEYVRIVGPILPVRPASYAIVLARRPADVLGFATEAAWRENSRGPSLVEVEGRLAHAIDRGAEHDIQEALHDLEHAIVKHHVEHPTPDKVTARRARWELMQTTADRARLMAFDAENPK